jgi:hypothetical protein
VTIIASGMYFPTLEKMFINTAAQSMEAETHKGLLVTDTYGPNFDTDAFRNVAGIASNEIAAGGGYTTGGNTVTGTEWTAASPATGTMMYDFNDPQWASSSITNAMAHVMYFNVGTAATDMLLLLQDFITAVTTSNGLLLVSVHVNGAVNLDHTP